MNLTKKLKDLPPRIGVDALLLRPAMSGVGRAIHHLVEHLPREGPEYRFVFYHSPRVSLPGESGRSNACFRQALFPTSLRPARILWQQAALPHLLRLDGVQLLHAPAYTAPVAAAVPVVLTIYDTIALKFPQFCKRLNVLHYRLAMPPSARRAARIIVPSEATKEDVVKELRVAEEKIRVIPLGVSREFRPVEDREELARVRAELGLPERYILFTGNIEPKKNLKSLVEAFAEAHRSGRITHRLVIAGRKGWRCSDVFRAVKALRLQGIVKFLDGVAQRFLPALYSGASVFVFPSLYEGFGLHVLEAMACGTPVVTTDAGALPEVAGDAALKVSPRSVRELGTAIEKITTNRFLAKKLRTLGLERAKGFPWAETARRTIAVYAEVLQGACTGQHRIEPLKGRGNFGFL